MNGNGNRLTECCVYVSKTWKGQDREAFICGHKALMVQLPIGNLMKDID